MTKKLNKRGFTIVELVVVIVVIAILAAVLIPTVSSLIDKANRSADIQAVNQMNKQLAINEITGGNGIIDVYEALEAAGMTVRDYHPLASNTYFFWVKELNRIVYVDNDYNILYPNEYEGKGIDTLNSTYLALGGDIKQVEATISNDGTVATVNSAEQLYWLSENINSKVSQVTEIKFDQSSIDLKGADIAIVVSENKSLKITGANGGTTLSGLVTMDSNLVNDGKDYACGLIANVSRGAKVEISNIIIDGATVGGYEIGGVGGLVGRINNGATVNISNCTVQNSTINGKNKVGALIGSIGGATVEIKGCKVDKCTVNCSEGESGKVIGSSYTSPIIKVDTLFSTWCTNTTLNLVATEGRDVVDANGHLECTATNQATVSIPTGCQKVVRVAKKGVPEFTKNGIPRYRMFADDAYMTIVMSSNPTIEINNVAISDLGTLYGSALATRKLDNQDIDINILYFETR